MTFRDNYFHKQEIPFFCAVCHVPHVGLVRLLDIMYSKVLYTCSWLTYHPHGDGMEVDHVKRDVLELSTAGLQTMHWCRGVMGE